MDINDSLIGSAESFVRHIFDEQVPAAYLYHDLHHTLAVVAAVGMISSGYQLPDREQEALQLAAWFHDTGYSRVYEDHEFASAQIATDFLRARQVDEEMIGLVTGCILATRMPQSPKSLIEEILCDADLYHLGTDAFETETKLLRKELNTAFGKDISKKDWKKNNLYFLQQHQYFTSFAKQHLDPVKQSHLQELLKGKAGEHGKENESAKDEHKKREKEKSSSLPAAQVIQQPQEHPVAPATDLKPVEFSYQNTRPKEIVKKEKEKLAKTERGIATMFRIMSDNHVSLSQMADTKANIMISVNTIVLSILVSVFLGKLQYYPQFIIPTIILVTGSLLAVVFAIMATRPNVTKGVFTEEDIRQKKVNLLFFGNFFKMELADYEWAMTEMMNDREYLYGSMIKDIYYLGKVLAKKYRYLRIAYNVFMFGLVLAIISFGIAGFIGIK